jgi:hypothetical protein
MSDFRHTITPLKLENVLLGVFYGVSVQEVCVRSVFSARGMQAYFTETASPYFYFLES